MNSALEEISIMTLPLLFFFLCFFLLLQFCPSWLRPFVWPRDCGLYLHFLCCCLDLESNLKDRSFWGGVGVLCAKHTCINLQDGEVMTDNKSYLFSASVSI